MNSEGEETRFFLKLHCVLWKDLKNNVLKKNPGVLGMVELNRFKKWGGGDRGGSNLEGLFSLQVVKLSLKEPEITHCRVWFFARKTTDLHTADPYSKGKTLALYHKTEE